MKTATQLSKLLDRYLRIPDEIDRLKRRLLGPGIFRGNTADWHTWEEKQARKKNLQYECRPPPRELSSDLNYQKILDLCEEMLDLWLEIQGDADIARADETLMREIMWSFPSLRIVVRSSNSVAAFHELLSTENSVDPQAYYAAHFVHEIQWYETTVFSGYRKFFLDRAFEVWDDEHKEAYVRWASMPFSPGRGLRTLSEGVYIF